MPRYELVDGTSRKFWQIERDGTSFTTTYGRIGTDGQTSLKEFDSDEKAKKEYDKLIAEKVKKGYQLVDGDEDGEDASAPAPKPPAAKPKAAATSKPVSPFDDEGDDEVDDDDDAQAAPVKGGEAGARYFELVDGKSSKFWEIQLDGASFTTRYGKIGTAGQRTLKEYASAALAQKEYEKLVAEKTKKGYVEK